MPLRSPTRHRVNRRAYRPRVELLEDRCTPSIVTWDGGGDGVTWNDPLNWDTNAVPGPLDDAVIGGPDGGFTVVGTSATVKTVNSRANLVWTVGFTLGEGGDVLGSFSLELGATLTLNGGSLVLSGGGTFGGPVNIVHPAAVVSFVAGNFVMTGPAGFAGAGWARVMGTGPVIILDLDRDAYNFELGPGGTVLGNKALNIEAHFKWTGGTLKNATTTILQGGQMDISGGCTLDTGALIVNEGAQGRWNGGNITMSNGARINNQSFFYVTAVDSPIATGAGGGTFNNTGTFEKSNAGKATIEVTFNNTENGIIRVKEDNGVLEFTGQVTQIDPAADAKIEVLKASGVVIIQKLQLDYGTLEGLGKIVITELLEWRGGTMKGDEQFGFPNGETVIDTPAVVKISDDVGINGRILTNMGRIEWISGKIWLTSARLANRGFFDILCDKSMFDGPGLFVSEFHNFGEIRKKAGAGGMDQTDIEPTLVSAGLVFVDAGILHLAGDGLYGDGMWPATFTMAAGTTLAIGLQGAPTEAEVRKNVSFEGAGLLSLADGRLNAVAAGEVHIENLELGLGGVLAGSGTYIVTTLDWIGGRMETTSGPMGSVTVTTLTIKSTDEKVLSNRKLTTTTTATWLDGNVTVAEGAQIENKGLFQVKCDKTMTKGAGAMPRFTNAAMTGVFRKTAGAGQTVIEIEFDNLGTRELKSGNTKFTSPLPDKGKTILDGGTISSTGVMQFDGILTGWGTMTGDVLLTGVFYVGGENTTGTINIQGNYQQTCAATLYIDLAFGSYDRLEISGIATLDGALVNSLLNGFDPEPGQEFEIMTFASRIGDFSSPPDLFFHRVYGPTYLKLVAY